MFAFPTKQNYSDIRPNGILVFFISQEKSLFYAVLFELTNYFKAPHFANRSA